MSRPNENGWGECWRVGVTVPSPARPLAVAVTDRVSVLTPRAPERQGAILAGAQLIGNGAHVSALADALAVLFLPPLCQAATEASILWRRAVLPLEVCPAQDFTACALVVAGI